ncbi:MAG: hypothetical protein DDT23_00953 [candidate division WS2 bacterium]|nr:hypothetical protein [Candidatus Lithacetigena glycinireducens]
MKTEKEKKECLRCQYKWTPLVENPVQCPRCKSTYWALERYEKYNRWQKLAEKTKQP